MKDLRYLKDWSDLKEWYDLKDWCDYRVECVQALSNICCRVPSTPEFRHILVPKHFPAYISCIFNKFEKRYTGN